MALEETTPLQGLGEWGRRLGVCNEDDEGALRPLIAFVVLSPRPPTHTPTASYFRAGRPPPSVGLMVPSGGRGERRESGGVQG